MREGRIDTAFRKARPCASCFALHSAENTEDLPDGLRSPTENSRPAYRPHNAAPSLASVKSDESDNFTLDGQKFYKPLILLKKILGSIYA